MRVLVVKLTSMGDAIHLLPALSDLQTHYSDIELDWMIEEGFAEIPAWHPSVRSVIPVATRRWRAFKLNSLKEFFTFWKGLRQTQYDVVIDAQGLIKSAVFARLARLKRNGRRLGFSASSIKEKPAARFYSEPIEVPRDQHAIERLRTLFAKGFNYSPNSKELNFQLEGQAANPERSVLFLHGTTWASKHLPETHWHELLKLAAADGYQVLLPWGNEAERARAQRIAGGHQAATVLPKSGLSELLQIIRTVSASVAVDTGLGHLAAALGVPTVSIYGSTNAKLTGALGANQIHIQADYHCSPCLLKQCDKLTQNISEPPCYNTVEPNKIWLILTKLLTERIKE